MKIKFTIEVDDADVARLLSKEVLKREAPAFKRQHEGSHWGPAPFTRRFYLPGSRRYALETCAWEKFSKAQLLVRALAKASHQRTAADRWVLDHQDEGRVEHVRR
jgi:hypothetical protein